MSNWTYITGTICVCPMGRTQAEKTYILQSVLDHLPKVTGSEDDMNVYTIQKNGYNSSSSHDEFGERTDLLTSKYSGKRNRDGWLETQDEYLIVVDAALRDRVFEETLKEFQKWLCRLAKRIWIRDVLVSVGGYDQSIIITDENGAYYEMFESPSWSFDNKTGEPTWCEYLMWQAMDDSEYPKVLGYKYFNDKENDKQVESWTKRGSTK